MSADVQPVTDAAIKYGDARAADQKATDDAATKTATDALKGQITSIQAEYDAYKAAHPDTPTQPPVTPPAATGTLLGTSLNGPAMKTTANGGLGYTKTTIARVYLRQLPAGSTWDNIKGDGTATSDLKDACAKATKAIWVSCKETDTALVEAFLKTKPALDQEIWWTHHHEPENDAGYTPAQFVAEQKKMSPIARKYGCRFATVLMRYTFSKASGRDWQAYFPADLASFVDIFGCDSYNTGNKKQTYSVPSDQIKPIKDAADARGLPWAIGETGASIFGAPAVRAEWAADLAAEAKAQKGLAVAWWDQDSYAFDQATATVWLGKP